MPSAQVHLVDGGHFSLDTAASEIAARVPELWICRRNQSQDKKSWQQQRRPPPFPAVQTRQCDAKGAPRRRCLEYSRSCTSSSGMHDRSGAPGTQFSQGVLRAHGPSPLSLRVNFEVIPLTPFPHLAFPPSRIPKTARKLPGFDGELMASFPPVRRSRTLNPA